jgi:hypothetical protein
MGTMIKLQKTPMNTRMYFTSANQECIIAQISGKFKGSVKIRRIKKFSKTSQNAAIKPNIGIK